MFGPNTPFSLASISLHDSLRVERTHSDVLREFLCLVWTLLPPDSSVLLKHSSLNKRLRALSLSLSHCPFLSLLVSRPLSNTLQLVAVLPPLECARAALSDCLGTQQSAFPSSSPSSLHTEHLERNRPH